MMKKLLQASIILLLFSIAILVVQSSCTKSQGQMSMGTATKLNKFIYIRTGADGPEIWMCDYDGNNAVQVPVTMPAGAALSTDFGTMDVKLSPDGQTVFFMGVVPATNTRQIYSCNVDGSNVKVVVPNTGSSSYIKIGGAY